MFLLLKPGQPHRLPRPRKLTNKLRLGILQRSAKKHRGGPVIRAEQLLEMRALRARTEEERAGGDLIKGAGVLDNGDTEGVEERFIEGIEDGVLRVDGGRCGDGGVRCACSR